MLDQWEEMLLTGVVVMCWEEMLLTGVVVVRCWASGCG